MMIKIMIGVGIALLALLWYEHVSAAPICMTAGGMTPSHDAKAMMAGLKKKYKEEMTGFGLERSGSALIVLASRNKKRSFTIMRVYASGKACIVAAGEDWDVQELEPPVF